MRAIRPIFDGRMMNPDNDYINSVEIRKWLSSEIHTCLQKLDENYKLIMVKRLDEEFESWKGRKHWYCDLLAVAFEINRWAKENEYSIKFMANGNIHAHMEALGLMDVVINEFTAPNKTEQMKILTDIECFHELKILLQAHWSRCILNWDEKYSSNVYGEQLYQNIILGPFTIEIDPDYDWTKDEDRNNLICDCYEQIAGKEWWHILPSIEIWLDDEREAPLGYVHCHSVNEAIRVIQYCRENDIDIDVIDCDHDLGEYAEDGGDAVKLLDWLVGQRFLPPIELHTMNPVGRENMQRMIKRYWGK